MAEDIKKALIAVPVAFWSRHIDNTPNRFPAPRQTLSLKKLSPIQSPGEMIFFSFIS